MTDPSTSPACGRTGMIISLGTPPRGDARRPGGASRERRRLLRLWAAEGGGDRLSGGRGLYVAPKTIFVRRRRGDPPYERAGRLQPGVTRRIDIPRTGLPDARDDAVIAHHVLDHVDDDRAAMREIVRAAPEDEVRCSRPRGEGLTIARRPEAPAARGACLRAGVRTACRPRS